MDAVAIAAALARRFEGLYLTPYLCPAGVPTIGYGATYYEDGTPVTLRDAPITRQRAEALLVWMIRRVYLPAVLKWCPRLHLETPGRVAALIDWTFNLGSGQGFSVREVIDAAASVTNRPVPIVNGPRRAGDAVALVSGSSRAQEVLGWTPKRSTLAQMIRDAADWAKRPGFSR